MSLIQSKDIELKCEPIREIFSSGDDDLRFMILNCRLPDGSEVVCKGKAPAGAIVTEVPHAFWGKWVDDEKYGKQFAFKHFKKMRPYGRRGVVNYLKGVPGIGDATAGRLFDLYQDGAVDALKTDPVGVANRVGGRFKPAIAQMAAEYLQEQSDLEDVTIELLDLFAGKHIQRKAMQEMVALWGNSCVEKARRNPLGLMRFTGIGFATADKLYMELGHPPAAIKRQVRCAENALAKRNGDTWVSVKDVRNTLASEISSASVNMEAMSRLARRAKRLRFEMDGGVEWAALSHRADDEHLVAKKVVELSQYEAKWPDVLELDRLYPHQRGELAKATRGAVGCLTGTPGTGKTKTLSELAKAIVQSRGPGRVAICCPTGKAAVRCSELMALAGLNITARTIHSTLGVVASDGEGMRFQHDESGPLPVEFVIVDEASMVDTWLMGSLLRACSPGTHVLLVGDTNQLLPVGHGAPLRDFIRAGVPTGELTEIHRNSGRIVEACKEIRFTGKFEFSSSWDIEAGHNLVIQDCRNPEQIALRLESILKQVRASGKYDMNWDVQVITPVRKSGPLSVASINSRLRDLLNPDGYRVDGNPFRVRDKIICLSNGWVPAVDKEDPLADHKGRIYCANGELAEVIEVLPKLTIAELQNPYRRVKIPMGKQSANGITDNESESKSDKGCDWDLASALTCHRAQGSEFPLVIVIGDPSGAASRICDRSYFYTAVSRAKRGAIYLGTRQTVEDWCRYVSLDQRKTFLAERLRLPLKHAMENRVSL